MTEEMLKVIEEIVNNSDWSFYNNNTYICISTHTNAGQELNIECDYIEDKIDTIEDFIQHVYNFYMCYDIEEEFDLYRNSNLAGVPETAANLLDDLQEAQNTYYNLYTTLKTLL